MNYRLNYASSSFTILWHTALIYVANALLEQPHSKDWYPYLMLCIYGYEQLSQSWRVADAISKGLLSMMLRKGGMTSENAHKILRDLEKSSPDRLPGEIRATFMLDLNRAVVEPGSATVEHLADQFEDNAMLSDYTNVFDR